MLTPITDNMNTQDIRRDVDRNQSIVPSFSTQSPLFSWLLSQRNGYLSSNMMLLYQVHIFQDSTVVLMIYF